MRFVIKNTCIIFLILCFIDSQAQFNTLVSSAPKTSNKYTPEVVNEELPAKEKKEFWNIFSFGKKKLQKQVDSLQAIIQSTQKKEVNIKKIEDSLETVLMKRIFSEVIHSKEKETIKKNIPKIAMPIKGNLHLTSDYGMRVHPIHNQWKMHNGIDLRADNQFVYAVLEGVVSEIGYDD
ncbi:MAG: M23 family peptidase, partial [Bacteroidota bacterium]|nr:M23 family peptidase [Bacteroidota bacterium]